MRLVGFLRARRRWLAIGLLLGLVNAVVTACMALGNGRDDADDVWSLVLWRSWRPFDNDISIPRDTYLFQALMNALTHQVFGPGRTAIVMAVVTLNIIGLWLFMFWLARVVERFDADEQSRLRLVTFGGVVYTLLSEGWTVLNSRSNFRSVEVAILLVVGYLIVVAAACPGQGNGRGSFDRPTVFAIGAVALACLNDAMVIYVGVAPAAAVIATRWVFERSTGAEHRVAMLLAYSSAAYVVVVGLFHVAGLRIVGYAPPEIIDLAELPERAARSLDFAMIAVSASVSGERLDDVGGLLRVARAAATLLVIVAAFRQRHRVPPAARAVIVPAALLTAAALLAATFAEIGAFEGQNPRYLVPLVGPFAALAVFAVAMSTGRTRAAIGTAVVASCLFTATTVVPSAWREFNDDVPTSDLRAYATVADRLIELDLEVGYGQYFVSVPLEYWARDNLMVTTSTCRTGEFEVGDFSISDVADVDVSESFVIQRVGDPLDACSAEQLDAQFGPPVSVERLAVPSLRDFPELEIRIYSGNIGRHVGRSDG